MFFMGLRFGLLGQDRRNFGMGPPPGHIGHILDPDTGDHIVDPDTGDRIKDPDA